MGSWHNEFHHSDYVSNKRLPKLSVYKRLPKLSVSTQFISLHIVHDRIQHAKSSPYFLQRDFI